MARLSFTFFFLFSACSFATQLEDVIYKKDGSILRGSIIEQDFEKGTINLAISGGSTLVIPHFDVSKITKETSENLTSQSSNTDVSTSFTPTYYEFTQPITGIFYLGTSYRTSVKKVDQSENKYVYSGFNIAGQRNLTQHLAFYTDMNYGRLSKASYRNNITGEKRSLKGAQLDYTNYSSVQLSLIFSTNLYEGWQLYTGAGKFYERLMGNDGLDSFKGHIYHLGAGYSWQNIQCHLRINFHRSDYPKEHIDNHNSHLQIGFNF